VEFGSNVLQISDRWLSGARVKPN